MRLGRPATRVAIFGKTESDKTESDAGAAKEKQQRTGSGRSLINFQFRPFRIRHATFGGRLGFEKRLSELICESNGRFQPTNPPTWRGKIRTWNQLEAIDIHEDFPGSSLAAHGRAGCAGSLLQSKVSSLFWTRRRGRKEKKRNNERQTPRLFFFMTS